MLGRSHSQACRRKPSRIRTGADGRFVRPLGEPRRIPLRFGWNADRRRQPGNELADPTRWRRKAQVAVEHGIDVRDATVATPRDGDDYGK